MDPISLIIAQVNATATEAVNQTTTRHKSTPEGMMTAYFSLVVMALLPIVIGAYRSVEHHMNQRQRREELGEQPETMSSRDAMMFPLIASGALFGLYLLFRIFSKEYINLLMTGYFVILGATAMSNLFSPILHRWKPSFIKNTSYQLVLNKNETPASCLIDFRFDTIHLISFALSSVFALWYLMKKHWVANNLFGIAFAINGVELLHLNSITTGCILLGGLFFYDVFWVFGTDVMVTVAKSFEAPIKLVFPQDFLEKGFFGTNFAMLGLGDIVIPGIFIALLLRFDKSLNRSTNWYFNASFFAYIVGLATTIAVMTIYNHAQPALLYLVPSCVLFPVTLSLIKGDFKAMFAYEDHPNHPDQSDTPDQDQPREVPASDDGDKKEN